MKKRKNIKKLLERAVSAAMVGVVLTALLAGCGNANKDKSETAGQAVNAQNEEQAEEENNTGEKLVVNIALIQAAYAAYVDQHFGYAEEAFADDNVEFVYTRFENGPAILEALESGSVDIVPGIGELPVITSRGVGRDVVLIAGNKNTFTWDVFVPEDSEATTLEDLKGKKIALDVGAQAHYALLSLAKEAGLTADDFEIINMKGSATEYLAAIESGEVDAFVSTKPTVPADSDVKVLVGAEANYDFNVVRGAFAKEHPEIVSKYLQVLQKSGTYLKENPQEAAEFISEINGQPVESLTDLLETSSYTHFLEELPKEKQEDIEELISFAVDQGLIPEAFTLDEFYDPSYSLKAGESDTLY